MQRTAGQGCYFYSTTPTPKAQDTWKKRGQKCLKSQRTRDSAGRLFPRQDREGIPRNTSITGLPKQSMTEDNTNRMLTRNGQISRDSTPTKNYRQLR